ncbi:MAG: sigma-70 family RNA polymerase sigma factor [Isosphaeraceae bacterium]
MLSQDGTLGGSNCGSAHVDLDASIAAARGGDRAALARALMSFRDYLLLVANEEMDPRLQAKEGASDLVQETFLQAQQRISTYRGGSRTEWRSWLRSILIRHIANKRRHFETTAKRKVHREIPIPEWAWLRTAGSEETPSSDLARREREAALIDALSRLPHHYQEVVIWHQRQRLTFEEIGRRRGISAEAARKIWIRALGRLRKELGALEP